MTFIIFAAVAILLLILSGLFALAISTEYRPGSLSFAIAFTAIGTAAVVPLFAAAGVLLSTL